MIEYIKGRIDSLTPTAAVIEAAGIGYLLNITLPTFTALQGRADTRLLVHEVIREDARILFGFLDERERELFRLLIGVSGIGANTARLILSSVAAPELEGVIISGDHGRLKAVKGIGAKTAERVIVDLRDKIKPSGDIPVAAAAAPSASAVFDEAMAALTALGFPRPQSQKALRRVFDADPGLSVERAIKQALAHL